MHLNTAVSSLMELVNELYAFSDGTARGAPARGESPAGASSGRRRWPCCARRSTRWS